MYGYNVQYYSGIMNFNHAEHEANRKDVITSLSSLTSIKLNPAWFRVLHDLPWTMSPSDSSFWLAHSVQLPSYTRLPSSG